MKNLIKTMKFWEITFLIFAAILISPLYIEFLLLAVVPLAVVGVIASVFAVKERKFYMIALNIFVVLGSIALYFYLW